MAFFTRLRKSYKTELFNKALPFGRIFVAAFGDIRFFIINPESLLEIGIKTDPSEYFLVNREDWRIPQQKPFFRASFTESYRCQHAEKCNCHINNI
jgi:hypothetical protein